MSKLNNAIDTIIGYYVKDIEQVKTIVDGDVLEASGKDIKEHVLEFEQYILSLELAKLGMVTNDTVAKIVTNLEHKTEAYVFLLEETNSNTQRIFINNQISKLKESMNIFKMIIFKI